MILGETYLFCMLSICLRAGIHYKTILNLITALVIILFCARFSTAAIEMQIISLPERFCLICFPQKINNYLLS